MLGRPAMALLFLLAQEKYALKYQDYLYVDRKASKVYISNAFFRYTREYNKLGEKVFNTVS